MAEAAAGFWAGSIAGLVVGSLLGWRAYRRLDEVVEAQREALLRHEQSCDVTGDPALNYAMSLYEDLRPETSQCHEH